MGILAVALTSVGFAAPPAPMVQATAGFEYLDTSFENASPLWYDFAPDGTVLVHLLYDHERSAPNRAAGHFHFLIHARPGTQLTLEFKNLDNVWNGRVGSVAREMKAAVISTDGRKWTPVALESLPENRVRLSLKMPGPRLYVARLEPYRLSDLEQRLARLAGNPLAEVTPIGKTVAGRTLEIVRIGQTEAPHHVFLRARAHPWESGGSWVVDGLIDRLLQNDETARKYRQRYCLWVMPMANKDGVVRGWTRFNLQGKDLNRGWDKPADPAIAPENVALEQWLTTMIAQGRRPALAIDFHNDGSGLLHLSQPAIAPPALEQYRTQMSRLERLLREHTWFTEGATKPGFHNPGTFGEGLLERYGVSACIHELNCNRIAGLNDYPTAANWRRYGQQLAEVFFRLFDESR